MCVKVWGIYLCMIHKFQFDFMNHLLFLNLILCSVCYSTYFGEGGRVLKDLSQNRLIIKDYRYLNLGRTKE